MNRFYSQEPLYSEYQLRVLAKFIDPVDQKALEAPMVLERLCSQPYLDFKVRCDDPFTCSRLFAAHIRHEDHQYGIGEDRVKKDFVIDFEFHVENRSPIRYIACWVIAESYVFDTGPIQVSLRGDLYLDHDNVLRRPVYDPLADRTMKGQP